jgi:hypothetical protein
VFIPPDSLTFPRDQGFLTNISFQFVIDGVAQEINETFTITFTIEEDAGFGATIIPQFTGTILDVDIAIIIPDEGSGNGEAIYSNYTSEMSPLMHRS